MYKYIVQVNRVVGTEAHLHTTQYFVYFWCKKNQSFQVVPDYELVSTAHVQNLVKKY